MDPAQILEENFLVHLTFLHRATEGMSVTEDGLCVVSDSGLAADYFNTLYLRPGDASKAVDGLCGAVRRFRSRALPFAVWVGSHVAGETLEILGQLGLKPVEVEPGFILGLMAWQPRVCSEVEIRPVQDHETLADFSRCLAAVPEPFNEVVVDFYRRVSEVVLDIACPMSLFVAYRNDDPVATCEVCITDGTAGIYNVTTRPEHRRRGIAAAMVSAGLSFAVSRRCALACLSSSGEALTIYRRLGFRECCSFQVYQ